MYTIVRGAGPNKNDLWVKIGGAFPNEDGSERVILHALPLDGCLQLHTPKAKGVADEQL